MEPGENGYPEQAQRCGPVISALSVEARASGAQGHLQLLRELETSLGYKRPHVKTGQNKIKESKTHCSKDWSLELTHGNSSASIACPCCHTKLNEHVESETQTRY